MTNWRTTIGGAIGNLGKALMGVGLLLQATDAAPESKRILWYVAFAGVILSCAAGFVTSLFAADARVLKEVVAQTNVNTVQIADAKTKLEETQLINKG